MAALLARRVGSEEPGDEGEREASVAGDATVGDAQEREFAVRAGLPLLSAALVGSSSHLSSLRGYLFSLPSDD